MKLSYSSNTKNATTPPTFKKNLIFLKIFYQHLPHCPKIASSLIKAATFFIKKELATLYNDHYPKNNLITQQQHTAIFKTVMEIADTKNVEKLGNFLKHLKSLTALIDPISYTNNNSSPEFISKLAFKIAMPGPEAVLKATLKKFELEDTLPNRLRLCDPLYISKRLKKEWRLTQSNFSFLLSSNALDCTKIEYVSDLAIRHYKSEQKQAEKFARNYQMVNEKGQIISGEKIFNKKNLDRNKYAEEVAFAVGLTKLAKEQGNKTAGMLTATMPSAFHPKATCPKTGKKITNPNFNGSTPHQTHKIFQKAWQRARANLAHKGQEISHFVRAAQPHKSGTPHYHITIFAKSEEHLKIITEEVAKQINQFWYLVKGLELTTETEIKQLKNKSKIPKGGVRTDILIKENGEADITGGLKYILAGLAYTMPDDAAEHKKSGRSLREIQAIKKWSRDNNIRRFTTSNGHRTLWRKLRAEDDFESDAQKAAKAGDYASFYTALHIEKNGEVIKEGKEFFQTLYIQRINKYTELESVPDSIFMIDKTTGNTHRISLESTWEIQKIIGLTVKPKYQEGQKQEPPPSNKFVFFEGNWQHLPPT